MSFDLYFYTRKGETLDPLKVNTYLVENNCVRPEEAAEWYYENADTEVYFSFEHEPKSEDPEDLEIFESFPDFDNTGYIFNLNFVRPNFFGLEAFPFVERFMSEFDLFALDPQSPTEPDKPGRCTTDEYYEEWAEANLKVCSEYFDAMELIHFPLERSNEYWRYNFSRKANQERLGDEYFVPSLLLAIHETSGEPVTATTWTEHIPIVFPPADYFILNRVQKSLFRTREESGIISKEKFLATFGKYLEKFEYENCHIIHPEMAERAAKDFNAIEFDAPLEGFFAHGIDTSKLTNAERSPEQRNLPDDQ